jgi:hypothetical protein
MKISAIGRAMRRPSPTRPPENRWSPNQSAERRRASRSSRAAGSGSGRSTSSSDRAAAISRARVPARNAGTPTITAVVRSSSRVAARGVSLRPHICQNTEPSRRYGSRITPPRSR